MTRCHRPGRPSRALVALLACAVFGAVVACSANAGGNGSASTEASTSSTMQTSGSAGGRASGTPPASHPSAGGSPPSTSSPAASLASSSGLPAGWVDQAISFPSDGMTIYGTFRHPTDKATPLPAALLIAGSGPTDRNGNSRLVPGSIGTLSNLAGALAANGLASLRYDKLGSGATGLGDFTAHPDTIGMDIFTHEAQAALRFLAAQPRVDHSRLSIYGHSEGALFALLLATDTGDSVPAVHSLGLLEPLSRRYLDIITEQATAQADQQLQAGTITQTVHDQVVALLHQSVTQLRTKGTVPADMGYGLNTLFAPSSLKFLRQADKIDPARLAAKLPATMPVLITCSNADIQVSCTDVKHLADAITSTSLDFLHLTGVDHVLKQDTSRTAANYGNDLPFSTQLTTALQSFTTK